MQDNDKPQIADPRPDPQSPDRGTFVPLIFGGAVATALGFFAAQIDGVERALGLAPPDDGLQQRLEAQADVLEAQQSLIDALRAQVDDVAAREIPQPEPVDLSGIDARLAEQTNAFDTLADRLSTLEKRPVTDSVSPEAIAAYEAELARLQAAVAAQRAEIETLVIEARTREGSAADQAELALARAAVTRVIAAVDSGSPYAAALDEVRSLGSLDIPAALAAHSAGVPTLADLQDTYADAARATLAGSRAEGDGSIGGFLMRQLNARSVTPKDGDGVDAILSRAEAATRQGHLGNALAELNTLPEAAQAGMADWVSRAQARYDAIQAADALLAQLADK